MDPDLISLLKYTLTCWFINGSLNFIYVAKQSWEVVQKWNIPLDHGKIWFDNRRILGNSTTWLGIPVALASGIIGGLVFGDLAIGVVQGVCVYSGHALGSFIKRRLGKNDGQFVPFVDHGDYVILSGLVVGLLGWRSWTTVLSALFLTFIFHPMATYIFFKLGWRKSPL
jgi:hypothetical protein